MALILYICTHLRKEELQQETCRKSSVHLNKTQNMVRNTYSTFCWYIKPIYLPVAFFMNSDMTVPKDDKGWKITVLRKWVSASAGVTCSFGLVIIVS